MQHGPVADLVVTPDRRTLVELADTQPVIARWRLDGTGPITRLLRAPGTPTGYDASGRLLLTSGPFDVSRLLRRHAVRSSGSSTPEPAPSSIATTPTRMRRSGPDDPASWPRGTGTTKAT